MDAEAKKRYKEIQEQKEIMQKKDIIFELYLDCNCIPEFQFFDIHSDKMLDEKIEIMTKVKNGTPLYKIPNYKRILENFPDGEVIYGA